MHFKVNSSGGWPQELALWGGIECSVVRVGERLRNQVVETGHHARSGDIEAVARLGIGTLRFPVVWETVAPDDPSQLDWGWHDRRLEQIRRLGIVPIVGLLHHGSGPRYSTLLDADFPEALARYAEQVARRYPWVEMFTPVNEPLTTARFSTLYGHWYPHRRDHACFLRTVVAQCRAIVLAMQAIRRVTPAAQLIQTEDLGRVFSTPRLRPQAEYENIRRWLSLDLLCGRVDRRHALFGELLAAGVGADDLDFLRHEASPPDIVGINHYLTSDRYLDERLEFFPSHTHGGNGRESYADTEAFRVSLPPDGLGPRARLREAWERYGIPIAVTEAHNGAQYEDQISWFLEVWRAAEDLRAEGADVRAVTAWSLFGAMDWNSLLTEDRGHYEHGAFDGRHDPARLTPFGVALARLADRGCDALTVQQGWWRRDDRVLYDLTASPAANHRERSRAVAAK